MLCGFPDIYDYTYTSKGGAGMYCLMDYGAQGGNPVQVCAYLKLAAGWAGATDIKRSTSVQAHVTSVPGPGFNQFYRMFKPGMSTEYFLMECRHASGRDA